MLRNSETLVAASDSVCFECVEWICWILSLLLTRECLSSACMNTSLKTCTLFWIVKINENQTQLLPCVYNIKIYRICTNYKYCKFISIRYSSREKHCIWIFFRIDFRRGKKNHTFNRSDFNSQLLFLLIMIRQYGGIILSSAA